MIYADVETDMKKMLTKPGDLNALSRKKKILLMGRNCYTSMIFINIVFEK